MLRLIGIGGHLGELVTDLKDPPGGEKFVESLNRYFGNVRAALQGPEGAAPCWRRRSIVFARSWTRRRQCVKTCGRNAWTCSARPGDLPRASWASRRTMTCHFERRNDLAKDHHQVSGVVARETEY